ncbi:MAG: hypothetical protein PUG36_05715 [Clostridiales bacterium]|nr:hypothetical protein [Clostridiales bacterium]
MKEAICSYPKLFGKVFVLAFINTLVQAIIPLAIKHFLDAFRVIGHHSAALISSLAIVITAILVTALHNIVVALLLSGENNRGHSRFYTDG